MGNCKDCAHWDRFELSPQYRKRRRCYRMLGDHKGATLDVLTHGGRVLARHQHALNTAPEFGCVLFEARAEIQRRTERGA
jgi:hypothetical protein